MKSFKERMETIFTLSSIEVLDLTGDDCIVKYLDEYLRILKKYLSLGIKIPEHHLYDIVADCTLKYDYHRRLYGDHNIDERSIEDKYEEILEKYDADIVEFEMNNLEELYLEFPNIDNEVFINIYERFKLENSSQTYDVLAHTTGYLLHDSGGDVIPDLRNYLNNPDIEENKLRLLNYIDNEYSPQWTEILKIIGYDVTEYKPVENDKNSSILVIHNENNRVVYKKDLPAITVYAYKTHIPINKKELMKIMDFFKDLKRRGIIKNNR